jgi:hypothetical protein
MDGIPSEEIDAWYPLPRGDAHIYTQDSHMFTQDSNKVHTSSHKMGCSEGSAVKVAFREYLPRALR